jgi:hypothetical protein
MKRYFYQLTSKCSNVSQILDYAISVEKVYGNNIWNELIDNHLYNTEISSILGNVIPLPEKFVEQDIVFKTLKKEIGLNFSIGKMSANNFYNLHVDKKRKFAINLILNNDFDSITFFSLEKFRDKQHKVIELHYQPDHFYLLDVLTPHAVLTRSKDRYFLTSGTITYSFNEVAEILKSLNLIDQHSL